MHPQGFHSASAGPQATISWRLSRLQSKRLSRGGGYQSAPAPTGLTLRLSFLRLCGFFPAFKSSPEAFLSFLLSAWKASYPFPHQSPCRCKMARAFSSTEPARAGSPSLSLSGCLSCPVCRIQMRFNSNQLFVESRACPFRNNPLKLSIQAQGASNPTPSSRPAEWLRVGLR